MKAPSEPRGSSQAMKAPVSPRGSSQAVKAPVSPRGSSQAMKAPASPKALKAPKALKVHTMKVWHSPTVVFLILGSLAAGCGHGSQSRNEQSEEAQAIQSTNIEDQEVDLEAEIKSWEARFRKNLQDVRTLRAELAVSVEKIYAARLLGSSTIIYRAGAKSLGSKGKKELRALFADTSQGMGYRIQFEIWGYSRETAKGLDPRLFELRCRSVEEHLEKEVKRKNLGELEVSRHFGPLPQGQGNEAFLIVVGTLLPPNL